MKLSMTIAVFLGLALASAHSEKAPKSGDLPKDYVVMREAFDQGSGSQRKLMVPSGVAGRASSAAENMGAQNPVKPKIEVYRPPEVRAWNSTERLVTAAGFGVLVSVIGGLAGIILPLVFFDSVFLKIIFASVLGSMGVIVGFFLGFLIGALLGSASSHSNY